MTDDEKRATLKAAGWRRFDLATIGERWEAPDGGDGGIGVTLGTAWRNHRKDQRERD